MRKIFLGIEGGIAFVAAFSLLGSSITHAALTFSATAISGDSNMTVDGVSTISIGASTATGITLGRSGQTITFPALGSSGSPCLTVNALGVVATTTCTTGGSVSTSSAISANNFPFWANTTGGLSGTSTLTISGTTIAQANAFNIGGNFNVTGTAMFASTFTQSGGLVSLASTTINGNATTTGNLAVLGTLFDSGNNKYVTSTNSAMVRTLNIEAPSTVDSLKYKFTLDRDCTITKVFSQTGPTDDSTAVSINLDIRAFGSNAAGTSVLSASLVADNDGQTSCVSGCSVSTIAAGSYTAPTASTAGQVIALAITNTSGSPVTLTYGVVCQ